MRKSFPLWFVGVQPVQLLVGCRGSAGHGRRCGGVRQVAHAVSAVTWKLPPGSQRGVM